MVETAFQEKAETLILSLLIRNGPDRSENDLYRTQFSKGDRDQIREDKPRPILGALHNARSRNQSLLCTHN